MYFSSDNLSFFNIIPAPLTTGSNKAEVTRMPTGPSLCSEGLGARAESQSLSFHLCQECSIIGNLELSHIRLCGVGQEEELRSQN